MDETPYPYLAEPIDVQYTFESVSHEKTVRKIVRLTETNLPNVFNLALLDVLANGEESDLAVTDNADMAIVLATVIRIMTHFMTKFPSAFVTFAGSDERRTRLYRLVISRELNQIQQHFRVLGQLASGQLENFQPNKNYERFYVAIKS